MARNSASQNVRDDLIQDDIRLRRVIGGQQRLIEKRQRLLERRVTAAIHDIDPGGVSGELRQAARLLKLQRRIKEITREVYGEHAAQLTDALLGVAKSETVAVTGAIEESV